MTGARQELAALRDEVREFVAEELGSGRFLPRVDSWLSGWDPDFSRRLAQRGWIGMTLPSEYGGGERSQLERHVVVEELLAAGAPVAAHWVADRQAGPSLLRYGSEAQRRRFLPSICRGECYFSIGMSEPDAGSDLAAVRTRARRVHGGWQVSGTKLWTSGAHRAHVFFVLCRTEPALEDRHRGLSQLVVPLDSPGVHIRPIALMSGEEHFNEVVLDEVFVPDDMVLGELGQGWQQVTSELVHERSGPERFLSTFPLLRALVGRLGDSPLNGAQAQGLGSAMAELWTLRQLSISLADPDGESVAERSVRAAMTKDLGTAFEQSLVDVCRELEPVELPAGCGDEYTRLYEEALLQSPGVTLRGGTTEMLRTIIARSLVRS